MNNHEDQIEINFFEPGMGLIITNLELLKDKLESLNIPTENLLRIIQKFDEIESLLDFELIANELEDFSKNLVIKLTEIHDVNQYELFSYLLLTTNWTKLLSSRNYLTDLISTKILNRNFQNETEVILEIKRHASDLINANFLKLKNNYYQELFFSDQFKKLLNVNLELTSFEDLKEGNAFLTEIFQFEQRGYDKFEIKIKAYDLLIANESLIILLDFWQEGLIN